MALAGLEEKSICFSKGGNSQHVHEKILEAFPILEEAGGYEILRTGERGNRQLMVVSMPPGGYNVPYLKATIASAKGYIRPYRRTWCFHLQTRSNCRWVHVLLRIMQSLVSPLHDPGCFIGFVKVFLKLLNKRKT